ncbi:MAG: hypothetical protein EHM50_01365 [Lysobacterales bacterium]|nr:MAG: hypothetical protein EHM50_01365 [Xanthomonadales bacterium]
MTHLCLTAVLGGVAASSLAGAAAQDDEDEGDEPLRCLSMNSIRSTVVVDDRRVLFFQARDRVFLNRLDRECLGLTRAGTFTYKVQSGARHARLCSTDSITVLETTGRGLNCGLGLFEPLSHEEVESVVGGPNRSIVSVPVELPAEEEPAAPPPEPPPQ